jgi:hypothetical protein
LIDKDHLQLGRNTSEDLIIDLEDELQQELNKDTLLCEPAEAEDEGRGLMGGDVVVTKMSAS